MLKLLLILLSHIIAHTIEHTIIHTIDIEHSMHHSISNTIAHAIEHAIIHNIAIKHAILSIILMILLLIKLGIKFIVILGILLLIQQSTMLLYWINLLLLLVYVDFLNCYDAIVINRIPGTVAYMRPPKLLASLQAHNIARYRDSDRVGHSFGKPCSLAWRPCLWFSRKLVAGRFLICLKLNRQETTLYKK